jgi:hypothetical protein
VSNHFTTAGKRYREGTAFAGFGALDVDVSGPSTTVDQTAPAFLPDGETQRGFLFWDTGRRITNLRHVRWTFSHLSDWSTWNAIAWYGVGGNGPGQPIVSLDAYWVGQGTLDPTPIDGPGSSFVNGPGAGDTAWPWSGNDHQVRTQWGPATIRALDHLRRSVSDPQLDFSSLQTLIFGGDDSSVFNENDDGLGSSGGVVTGIAATTAQTLSFAQGAGASVMAGYVQPVASKVTFPGSLIELIDEAVLNNLVFTNVDPSPDDLVRLKLIVDSIDLVRGERVSADVFSGLVDAARGMSKAELTRTIAGTKATLARGEAALKSLQAIQAKAPAKVGSAPVRTVGTGRKAAAKRKTATKSKTAAKRKTATKKTAAKRKTSARKR